MPLRRTGTSFSGFQSHESSASNVGVAAIPSQFKVTHQILFQWQSFRFIINNKILFWIKVGLVTVLLRAFRSEFFEKPIMNLKIQKFKVQVRKMWFRAKWECQ
jgi:hypothetical protein